MQHIKAKFGKLPDAVGCEQLGVDSMFGDFGAIKPDDLTVVGGFGFEVFRELGKRDNGDVAGNFGLEKSAHGDTDIESLQVWPAAASDAERSTELETAEFGIDGAFPQFDFNEEAGLTGAAGHEIQFKKTESLPQANAVMEHQDAFL